jgi:hypothetical protein
MDSGQFKQVLRTVSSAAVAKNGTITFNYPAGFALADYLTTSATMFARGLMAYFDITSGGISAVFGASSVVVTYKGETSIPAGSQIDLEVQLAAGGVQQLVPLADPATATLPQVATLLNQVVAALQKNAPPLV